MDVTVISSEKWKRGFHQLTNRVHVKMYRKAVPTLEQRIRNMFNYAG